ncbi:MAG: hypothetical protein CBB72_011065, partial [Muricauda sp. TMED12]
FIYSFIHLFIYSFIHLFIYSFIHLFIYSFIQINISPNERSSNRMDIQTSISANIQTIEQMPM